MSTTLFFVYTSAQLTATGSQPIKKVEPGTKVSLATTVVQPGQSATVPKGIYFIFSSNELESPAAQATTGTPETDYDKITTQIKDPWPDPQVVTTAHDQRIKGAFGDGIIQELKTSFDVTYGL